MSKDGMRHVDDARLEELRVHGARLRDVLAEEVHAEDVLLDRVDAHDLLLRDVRLRGAELVRVEISGELRDVTVNGVDVGPLVEAELVRRHPEYAAMKPADAAGFRHAWDVVGRLWDGTVDRARGLGAAPLHESVAGEWSFVETLRHLAFATECWILRGVLAEPAPWHPLSLPWDGMPDTEGVPRDRAVRPDLDTVLALRRERADRVRAVLDGLTDDDLDREVVTPAGPGWPSAGMTFPVREALLTVLNEEWWHRQYAERDLDVLASRAGRAGGQRPKGNGSRVIA